MCPAFAISAGGTLTQVGTPSPAGFSPVGVSADATGNFLYVTSAIDNTLSAFRIDLSAGSAEPNCRLADYNRQRTGCDCRESTWQVRSRTERRQLNSDDLPHRSANRPAHPDWPGPDRVSAERPGNRAERRVYLYG